MITAIRLALDLLELDKVDRADSIWVYSDSDRTLQEIAVEKNLPRNGVIIFENVFDRGRMSADALFSRVSNLNTDLALREVRFIFTVPANDDSFPLQDLIKRYPIFNTAQPELEEVFRRFVDSYFDERDYPEENQRLKALIEKIPGAFQEPRRAADIDYWFRLHGNDIEQLVAWLLEEKYLESQATRRWFESLPNLNYKLYALLVVLFEGLDLIWLDQIYEASVAQLRKMGMDGEDQFVDPRRIGSHALEGLLQLRRRGNQIDFIDDVYRSEVEHQIENYQRLLWTLVDSFIAVVKAMNDSYIATRKQHSKLNRRSQTQENPLLERRLIAAAQDMDNMRRLRDVIAAALAKLGVFHIERLHAKIDELAQDNATFVVLTASGILAHLARDVDHQDMVLDILGEWVRSGDFDLMWAAAASISRVYEAAVRENYLPDSAEPPADEAGAEPDRVQSDVREFLTQIGVLLEELAKNYKVYDELYKQRTRDSITNTLLGQLADEFAQLIQDAVRKGSLPGEVLTAYQAAQPHERVLLALHVIPSAAQKVEERVKTLFEARQDLWCDQVRLGVVNAVAYIASTRPREMIKLVEGWVSGKKTDDPVREVGYMTLNRLFAQTNDLDAVLLEKQAFPLLRSFQTLMRLRRPALTSLLEQLKALRYDETVIEEQKEKHREVVALLSADPLSTALKAVLNWYLKAIALLEQPDADDEEDTDTEAESLPAPDDAILKLVSDRCEDWEKQVYPELLKAINYATHEQQVQFRQAIIESWLLTEHDQFDRVRRVAHALIARSHVMDGRVMDLPQAQRTGVIVVDGSADDEVIHRMYALAQRLSALVPIQVMRLGDARQVYRQGTWSADRIGDESPSYFTATDLSQKGHRRPPLLMPLLQPRAQSQREAFAADTTYFVLVYANDTIADLPDFFDSFPLAAPAADTSGNIFAQKTQARAAQAQTTNWVWNGKLIIVSKQSPSLSAAQRNSVFFVSDTAVDYAYSLLERQVARMLHRMTSPADMWRNIESYLKLAVPRTAAELKPQIETWLSLLNDIQHTHPRDDASLTIAWVLLALSRESQQGCLDAVSIIEGMLKSRSESAGSANLQHQMGMACARMLFNFYNAYPTELSAEHHGSLLRLLPAFNRAARDYSDLIPVWEVLISWTQSATWLALLQPASDLDEDAPSGGKLFESIDLLKERDARAARRWLARYDRLPEFWELFAQLGKSVDELIGLILKAHTYRQEVNARAKEEKKRRGKQPPLQAPLQEPVLTRLLSFIPENLSQNSAELEVLGWQIEQINANQRDLLASETKEASLQRARNMQTVAERLRDRLSRRLAGELPEFKGIEKYYGVILFQGDHKRLATKAWDLAKTFVRMRMDGQLREVVLTLHRQGSRDLTRQVRKAVRHKENDLFDPQKRLPLLGPALDRYANAHVGFVIVLSEQDVLDYDDWGEREGWGERLWTIRPANAKWQPSRGEHLDIGESSDVIMEQIANRMMQRTTNK